MNFRKFSVILACVTAGFILLAMYTSDRNPKPAPPSQPASDTATASAPTATATSSTAPATTTQVATAPAPETAPATPATTTAATTSAPTTTAASTPAVAPDEWGTIEDEVTRTYTIGSLDKKNTGYEFQVELTNDGASICNLRLSEFYATAVDKRLADKLQNDAEYLSQVAQSNGKYRGHYVLMNPLTKGGQTVSDLEHLLKQGKDVSLGNQLDLPMATRRITIRSDSTGTNTWNLEDARWKVLPQTATKDKDSSISFAWTVGIKKKTDKDKPILQLVKTYTIKPNDYSIYLSLSVDNLSSEPLTVNVDQAGPTSMTREDVRSDERKIALGRLDQDKVKVAPLQNLADGSVGPKSIKDILNGKVSDTNELRRIEKVLLGGSDEEKPKLKQYFPDGQPLPVLDSSGKPDYKEDSSWWRKIFSPSSIQSWAQFCPALGRSDSATPTVWMGQANKFFAAIMYLPPADPAQLTGPRPTMQFRAFELPGGAKLYRTEANLEQIKVAPGKSSLVQVNLFAGPKDRDLFDKVDLYRQLDYRGTIELKSGCSWCAFDWLTLTIMWLLEFLGKWATFGNYGVAIIILVIVVRVLLHPLTKKGQVSMMKMQKLAPKMAELKEKYKDDKDTLQRETMKFYKEQGATPILGCLPMLLQMPIWIALYTGLSIDVALRHASFLPFWITDLSGQDAIFAWANNPINIPLVGGLMGPIVSFNLLPILLTVAMYYQTKLTPTSMGAAATPQQAQQQKMMKIMTPVMMLLFFYNAPAGLNLYIMTSTFSSVFEQIIIRKHIKEREAAEAAAETTVAMPGKGARGSRAKKPKGPFWTKRG